MELFPLHCHLKLTGQFGGKETHGQSTRRQDKPCTAVFVD